MVTVSWLKNKLDNHENGVIINNADLDSFHSIHDFLEILEHPSKTFAIYYQAFSGESSEEFLATLKEELTSKLAMPQLSSANSLSEIVIATKLRMIILDQSDLCSLDTLNELLYEFAKSDIRLILAGSYHKLKTARILSHPTIKQWEQFTVGDPTAILSAR